MATARQIKDRERLTDHVADVMQERWPSWSIDTLLTHPVEALEMAVDVAIRAQRLPERRGRALLKVLSHLGTEHAADIEAINEICRCALSSRKRGDLRRDRV